MGNKVTVIGSFLIGMTLRTSRMPIFGETLIGRGLDVGPGGKGSNQAVGAARLGASVSFASIIGDDMLSRIGTELYKAEGIDTTMLRQTATGYTGAAFIILNERGENGILIDSGANNDMEEAFVESCAPLIQASDIVITVLEIPPVAAIRAMQLGKQHGVRTLLNPAPATQLDDSVFQFVDYVTPNETELRILMGLPPDDPTPTVELAKRLHARGVKHVIVTQGEHGALVLSEGTISEVAGIAVEVVDTTGAGDAFTAGLAVALVEGRDLIDAVRFANCCGALACTALGVIPALANRDTVDQLYRQHYA